MVEFKCDEKIVKKSSVQQCHLLNVSRITVNSRRGAHYFYSEDPVKTWNRSLCF